MFHHHGTFLAVQCLHHQGTAESTHNNSEDQLSSGKSDPVKLFAHCGYKQNLSSQSLPFNTETVDEFKQEAWFSRGLWNLEESPSEESDALREAYRSLGLGRDFDALQKQCDRLEIALRHAQEQLEVVAEENTQLKLQLRKQTEEVEGAQQASRGKIGISSPSDGGDHLQPSIQDNTILNLAQDDLVQGLNQENRALADRIEELLAHIELGEGEIEAERTQLKEQISRLEEDRSKLEQENQEQGCLITELTRKTEDDLNTIMELQQKLAGSGELMSLEACVDSVVESVLKGKEEPQLIAPQDTLHVSSLTDQVDHLTKTVQSLKAEQDELSGNISCLRQQQEEVTLSVKTQTEEKQQLTRGVWGLKEEKDRISQCLTGLKQEREQLTRKVCGLRDERDHFIRSMSDLKEEKGQLMKSLSGLEREKEALTESLSNGKEEREQIRQAVLTLKQEREKLTISHKYEKEQGEQEQSSYTLQDGSDEQSDLMREIEDLGAQLEKSREEVGKSREETKKLYGELNQSEARREQAERKAAHAAEKMMRLTDVTSQMEETTRENENLSTQVKELQSKLSGLVREKTDALSLKTQIQEQYKILTAQLKAKTVALEELNSEYIVLKREQDSKDDRSTALMSLRTRYNDIRAKYDALLKKRSQTDLDIAPLKTCTAASTPANEQHQNRLTPEPAVKKCSERYISISTTEPSANIQACKCEVSAAATGDIKNKANSPVPTSPVQENTSVTATPVLPPLKENLVTDATQPSPSASGPIQASKGPETFGLHHLDVKGKSSPDLTSSAGSSQRPAPPTPSMHSSPSRRLSSPEKIINLHEELQRTLMSSYKAPVSRGRGHEPRKSLSFSAPEGLNLTSQTNKKQSFSFNKPHSNSVPVTTASSQTQHTPVVTTELAATKSTTLFNAVASRSANVAFNPNTFTYHHSKADISKTTVSAHSSSSTCPIALNKDKATNMSSPKLTKTVTALPNISDTVHTASTPSPPRTATTDSNVLICSDTNSKTTASSPTVPGKYTAPSLSISNGAAPPYDELGFAASGSQSAHRSPERSNKPARPTTAALDKTKPTRPRPEAPAEVRSVEVIKTVGQSSLMIGWERPPLDELGCSNGTFVYGYRVFIDGDFHKSVMSSACTKCIVENVDLSVPVHISVQTLGSNGLSSNSVDTTYRTSARTDQH
ncbi:hypothetical protein INR49_024440 [Caranx melampygus]|nr:hypothetical protein INR49_024440 [Caranx melampygus]